MTYRSLYIVGLLSLVVAEKITGGNIQTSARILSYILLLLSSIDAYRKNNSAWTSVFISLGLLSGIFFWMGSDIGSTAIGISEDNLLKWQAATLSLASILMICSILPSFALFQLSTLGEHHVNPARSKQQALLWLSTAFLLSSLVTINYIAHDTNKRWDLGYFKTATPGESTISILDNLEKPIHVYLFFQMNMDITDEIRSYFDLLPTQNIDLHYLDKDIEPALAKELNIRENGTIALVKEDSQNNGEKKVQRINVGKDLSSGKRVLKKLDEEFREKLLELTKDANTLYFTNGHGELYWKVEDDGDTTRNISLLKKGLSSSNFIIKELNIGNGLANEIPEDAKAVIILAPQIEFSEAEVETIYNYWEKGNSVFIALEANGATLDSLLSKFDLRMHSSSLGHSTIFMPVSNRPVLTDTKNLITNKFSTHPAVTTLSRYNKSMYLVLSNAGYLEQLNLDNPSTTIKSTVIIKTMEDTWDDLNNNYAKDALEKMDTWPVAIAIEKDVDKAETNNETSKAKGIVFSDASWLTDTYLAKGFTVGQQTIQPHAITLSDTLFWLTDSTENSGTVNSEQDVKIQHSKEGQGWIFFGSTFLFPLLFFALGSWNIRNRFQKNR